MTREDGRLIEWIMPLAFIGVAAYVVWNFPRFIISFGWAEETGALMATNPPASILDFAFLLALPIVFVVGTMTVKAAKMEFFEGNVIDKSVFMPCNNAATSGFSSFTMSVRVGCSACLTVFRPS